MSCGKVVRREEDCEMDALMCKAFRFDSSSFFTESRERWDFRLENSGD